MSQFGYRDRRDLSFVQGNDLSSDGRWAMALGVIALLIGLGTATAGAWLGFGSRARLVSLPAGLPTMDAATLGMMVLACGVVTMLLGVISVYKAHDM